MSSDSRLQLKIDNVHDLELFANCIKDATVGRISTSERFSAIRLSGAPLTYNDFIHKNWRGLTDAAGRVEVRQANSALDMAGTVIHEMSHVLVGVQQSHNENWREACHALGIINPIADGREHTPEDFDPPMLRIILDAIARFAKDHPKLVYDPDIEIPWPAHVGTPECKLPRDSDNACEMHRVHIFQFQIDGIREMLSRSGNILLADEMGLGKTVEVMGYINATHPKRILIGCPNNAKLVWRNHFRDYCIHKDYDVTVAYSNMYTFDDVIIMNYEAITKWADALKNQEWDLIIHDECHYLKTPNAKRSRACYAIHGAKAIFVTGSPIVNYFYEIFPLIHYLDRERWPEYGRFEYMFGSRSSERFGRNLNKLNAMLRATLMTRRLKKDVLTELPRKRRQIIEFEVPDNVRKLIEEEKKLFNAMQGDAPELANFLNSLRNESDVAEGDFDWSSIIEQMRYTRRYAFEEMSRIAHLIGVAKLPWAIEHIENALEARERVAVFGHHRDVLTAIADKFKPYSILHMGGSREPAVVLAEQFSNNRDLTVFVGQLSIAHSYSLRGLSTGIFVEQDWVPGVIDQAEARLHGIGRGDAEARSCLYQHLTFEDSLDTYKAKMVIKKLKSIERALNK